jgi:hypothetical protein
MAALLIGQQNKTVFPMPGLAHWLTIAQQKWIQLKKFWGKAQS